MTSILLIGILGLLLVILFKRPLVDIVGKNNKLVHKLKNAIWFQNAWLSGLFLFVMNAVLFFSACLMLYGVMFFYLPFVHLLIMMLAVSGSLYLWISINKAWEGTKKDRLKMGTIGSSVYLFLTFVFIYWFVTLKPAYPGEDTFMRAIGIVFAILVTTIAFITCFVIAGFSRKNTAN